MKCRDGREMRGCHPVKSIATITIPGMENVCGEQVENGKSKMKNHQRQVTFICLQSLCVLILYFPFFVSPCLPRVFRDRQGDSSLGRGKSKVENGKSFLHLSLAIRSD
jgi:hypothetical protein